MATSRTKRCSPTECPRGAGRRWQCSQASRRLSGDSPAPISGPPRPLDRLLSPAVPPRGGHNDGHHGPGSPSGSTSQAPGRLPGHQQPVIPGELGFYDLRVPEVREAQAGLARQYGISAFCWWHYWSLGRRLLERPFRGARVGRAGLPVLSRLGQPRLGHGSVRTSESIVVAQEYGGDDDHARHSLHSSRPSMIAVTSASAVRHSSTSSVRSRFPISRCSSRGGRSSPTSRSYRGSTSSANGAASRSGRLRPHGRHSARSWCRASWPPDIGARCDCAVGDRLRHGPIGCRPTHTPR